MASTTNNQSPPVFDDKPELFDRAFAKVKKAYDSGKTKPYAFRLQQLKNLKEGLLKMEKDFDKALTQDLGKDTFVNWVLEFTACIRECDDAISNLKSWMKDQSVHTPMIVGPGKSYI